MTDSTQEPKIIDRFVRIEFLVDGERKQIPSQQMLEALIYFPKSDAPDPYNIEGYRQRNDLRNRKYDSGENQLILMEYSNQLINDFDVYSLSENVGEIIRWYERNNLSYHKYFYAELMCFYCHHILPPTTSRYTAISGNLEIEELNAQGDIQKLVNAKYESQNNIKKIDIEESEIQAVIEKYPYYSKKVLFAESLERRFPEFCNAFPIYDEFRQQMLGDKEITNLLSRQRNDIAKQIRRDKTNKLRTEVVLSQCVFCYKFHLQKTSKEERGKTALVRYCPECKKYNRQWEGNKNTPLRRRIPLNGW